MQITTTRTSALRRSAKPSTPILGAERTSMRPPKENWVLDGRCYSSQQLTALAPGQVNGKKAEYVFRTSSLKRSAAMVGVSTAAGAGLGAVSAPLLSSLGRVAQSAASVLLWPHAPAPTGTAGLLQTMVGGALVGAVTFGTFHTALVGGFHVADLLSPTRVEGELEGQNGRLTFKIPEAKHAIDLKTHAEAKQTTWGNSNQWWEEVEQDAIGQSAGYPGHLDF